jgi:hypothetical protein
VSSVVGRLDDFSEILDFEAIKKQALAELLKYPTKKEVQQGAELFFGKL